MKTEPVKTRRVLAEIVSTRPLVGSVVLFKQHFLRICLSLTVPKVFAICELDHLTRLNWLPYPEFYDQLSRLLMTAMFVVLSKTLDQLTFGQMSQGP